MKFIFYLIWIRSPGVGFVLKTCRYRKLNYLGKCSFLVVITYIVWIFLVLFLVNLRYILNLCSYLWLIRTKEYYSQTDIKNSRHGYVYTSSYRGYISFYSHILYAYKSRYTKQWYNIIVFQYKNANTTHKLYW